MDGYLAVSCPPAESWTAKSPAEVANVLETVEQKTHEHQARWMISGGRSDGPWTGKELAVLSGPKAVASHSLSGPLAVPGLNVGGHISRRARRYPECLSSLL